MNLSSSDNINIIIIIMDEIFSAKNQLIQWNRHDEASLYLAQDGFEFLKELLIPLHDEPDFDHPEGKYSNISTKLFNLSG